MSYTDQAFIRAYQTDTDVAVPPPAVDVSPWRTHESHHHGPHASFGGAKRPLSEAVEAAGVSDRTPHQTHEVAAPVGLMLASLSVPDIVTKLSTKCGDDYRRMLSYASRSGQVIGLLGAGAGVGCTTTTLAAAIAASLNGPPVAVIDAAPNSPDLARSLGILSAVSLSATLSRGGAAEQALVYSARENLSVGIAFSPESTDERRVSSALRSLNSTHAAVLVDLGCDVESLATRPAQGVDSLRLDAVVIVRQANRGEAEMLFARRVLAASGQTVVGVIESFAA